MAMYKLVYNFEVLDKLRSGGEVYVLDRESRSVSRMSKLNVIEVVKIIDHDNKDNRYEMWETIGTKDGKKDE